MGTFVCNLSLFAVRVGMALDPYVTAGLLIFVDGSFFVDSSLARPRRIESRSLVLLIQFHVNPFNFFSSNNQGSYVRTREPSVKTNLYSKPVKTNPPTNPLKQTRQTNPAIKTVQKLLKWLFM